MSAGSFCASYDGAEVVRVGYGVANNDKGLFATLCGKAENILNACVFVSCGKENYALVILMSAKVIELFGVNLLDGNTSLLALCYKRQHGALFFAGGHQEAVGRPVGIEGLLDGISADYNISFYIALIF